MGINIVFKVGLALLKHCHDDLVKLSFKELMHALRNFPEDAMDPNTLLVLACFIKDIHIDNDLFYLYNDVYITFNTKKKR